MLTTAPTITATITADSTHHADVPALVESIDFGSDGLRYRRLDVKSQLERFNCPLWFHAMSDGKLTGVYVLDKRDLLLHGKQITGYYRGVLAVGTQWQGQGVGRQLVQSAMQWMAAQARDSQAQDNAIISYGCIDQSNTRSLQLLRSSGATISSALSMYMMYRQWPRKACELETMDEAHSGDLAVLADRVYEKCAVRDITASRLPGFLLKDEHGVAVSARVSLAGFRIVSMSRLATWCTRLFVHPFAPARKRFDPDAFRYVSFNNVLIRPGSESLWPRFVSTVLADHDCHFGMLYVDPHSELFSLLQSSGGLARLLHSSKESIQIVLQTFPHASAYSLPSEKSPHSSVHLWPLDA